MELSEAVISKPAGVVEANGPDALTFLQGQFSQDLSRLEEGMCVYGLWLNRKGKIEGDSIVFRFGAESFVLLSYYYSGSELYERLDKHLIMDEVELSERSECACLLTVFGEDLIGKVVRSENLGALDPGAFVRMEAGISFCGERGDSVCREFLFDSADALEKFCKEQPDLNCSEMNNTDAFVREALVSLRPRVCVDVGVSDLPQEVGLEGCAVSYAKGCYLGQEVMARIKSMGRVRKSICGARVVEGDLGAVSLPADLVSRDGKKVGTVRLRARVDGIERCMVILNTSFEAEQFALAGDDGVVFERL